MLNFVVLVEGEKIFVVDDDVCLCCLFECFFDE